MAVWSDYLHCNTNSLVSLTLCWSILHLQQSADPICFRWWPSTYLPLPTLQLKVWFCSFSVIFVHFLPPPPLALSLYPSVASLCPSSKWHLGQKFLNLLVVWFWGRGKYKKIETEYVWSLTWSLIFQYWEGLQTNNLFVWGRGEGGSQFVGGRGSQLIKLFFWNITSHSERLNWSCIKSHCSNCYVEMSFKFSYLGDPWAQLFEGRFALTQGQILTWVSFPFVQKHLPG